MNLRQETPQDHKTVAVIIEAAFQSTPHSDHTEHHLVERLRNSDAFVPELSLVAEINGEVAGHILLTKITINDGKDAFPSLALAPVSVKPEFQNQGIGGQLIREAHHIAKDIGFTSIVLLGHEKYYPRFGYERTSKYGITLPFEAPKENCMVIELIEKGLEGVSGMVEYDPAFFE